MDGIVLYNSNGQRFEVEIVRYFSRNNYNYLIFSLNEIVENGYMQLYASKVTESFDNFIIDNIVDDQEWARFKEYIQEIVINNRNNVLNQGDLDYKVLDGKVIKGFRIFKLKTDIAKILSEKTNSQISKEIDMLADAKTLEAASAQDTGLTIEQILKQVSEVAKEAREASKENVIEPVKPKKSIEDLLNKEGINDTTPIKEVLISSIPELPNEYENSTNVVPKIIENNNISKPVTNKPVTNEYKEKYEEALEKMKRLEDENIRLINELVEAKAKVETIKDIIN